MELNPLLLETMVTLGITPEELETLMGRMMFAVTNLRAQLSSLDAQIEQLQAQRSTILAELSKANVTVAKLMADQAPPNG